MLWKLDVDRVQSPSRSAAADTAAATAGLFHTISSGDVRFVHRTRPTAPSTLLNLRPGDLCQYVDRQDVPRHRWSTGRPASGLAGGDRLIDGCRPNGRLASGNLHLDRLLSLIHI